MTGEKPLFFFLERYMDAYGKEIAAFIDAIVNDTETPLGVMDGLKPVLMGLAAKEGDRVEITVEGPDEEEAAAVLERFMSENL